MKNKKKFDFVNKDLNFNGQNYSQKHLAVVRERPLTSVKSFDNDYKKTSNSLFTLFKKSTKTSHIKKI